MPFESEALLRQILCLRTLRLNPQTSVVFVIAARGDPREELEGGPPSRAGERLSHGEHGPTGITMASVSTPAVYEFRTRFRAPLPFVFAWCTDYSPNDARLEGEDYTRRILRRTARQVVFEDLDEEPTGWIWSHMDVDLHPPNRWHAESVGSHRDWSIDYELSPKKDGSTELWFRGKRWAMALAGKNPPEARLEGELRGMWKRFGRALEKDYRASQRSVRKRHA